MGGRNVSGWKDVRCNMGNGHRENSRPGLRPTGAAIYCKDIIAVPFSSSVLILASIIPRNDALIKYP